MRYTLVKYTFLSLFVCFLHFSKADSSLSPAPENTPALAGIFTIGGSGADYQNITQAVEALKTEGVSGPCTFAIRAGTYQESIAIPEITGASAENTITFRSENDDPSTVIWEGINTNYILYLEGSDWLRFQHLTFSNSRGMAYISDNATENIFSANYFYSTTNNSYQVVFEQATGNNENHFLENTFENGFQAIQANGFSNSPMQGLEVQKNVFLNQARGGLQISNQVRFSITQNIFRTEVGNNYRAISLNRADGTAETPVLLANNYIQVTSVNDCQGLEITNSDHLIIAHNSVLIDCPNIYSEAIYYYSGNNVVILNNIFYHMGAGYAAYYRPSSVEASNNNLFYSNGTRIGYWSGDRTTLSDWQSYRQQDIQSISIAPAFAGATDYRTYQLELNNVGIPIPEIMVDIEDQTRSSTAPDIGAFEFDPLTLDVGVFAVQLPERPFRAETQPVYAQVKNYGTATVTSLEVPWQFNGVPQETATWSGALSSGDSTTVLLGNPSFSINQAHRLEAWTSNPNGQQDLLVYNDTATLDNWYAGLEGTYLIGGAESDFENLTQATTQLNEGGVLAEVTFNIRPGTYSEALTLRQYLGSDSLRQVIFQSENRDSSQVILEPDPSNADLLIRLDGADWITWRDLTLTGPVNIVRFENHADHNTISSCFIANTNPNYYLIYHTAENANQHNAFIGNTFQNGHTALFFDSPSNQWSSGLRVLNNHFTDQRYYGIFAEYSTDFELSGNELASNTANQYQAIWLSRGAASGRLVNNRVQVINSGYAIHLSYLEGTIGDHVLVANNFLQLAGADNNTGIFLQNTNNTNVYHNTVRILPAAGSSRGFPMYVSDGKQTRVYNNIFSNHLQGTAVEYRNTASIFSDYNLFYTAGAAMGYWNSLVGNLADWQQITNLDLHSAFGPPYFQSDPPYRVAQFLANDRGIYLPEIPVDLEGQVRDTLRPDLGVLEFALQTVDAGVTAIQSPPMPFPAGEQEISAEISNFSGQSLTQAVIQWEVNEVPQSPFNWSGNLATGATTTVTLGIIDFQVGQAYQITAWTEMPNQQTDLITVNDTLTSDPLYAGLGGIYTVGGTTPDFSTPAEAVSAMARGGLVDEVRFLLRDGTYSGAYLLSGIPGAGLQHPIYFGSENGDAGAVILTSTESYLFYIDGVDGITFENLSFRTSLGVFNIYNGADHFTLSNCTLEGLAITRNLIDYTQDVSCHFNRIINNRFLNGYGGLLFLGNSNEPVRGTEVIGNEFTGQRVSALQLNHHQSPKLLKNRITSENHQSPFTGISLDDIFGEDQLPAIVANNFIHIGNTTQNSNGIVIGDVETAIIAHNSIHLTNTVLNSAAMVVGSEGNDLTIHNNIFANSGGGYAFGSFSSSIDSRNNLFFTIGDNFYYYQTQNYANLEAVTALGLESGSISFDPNFTSDTDLHVGNTALDRTGIPVPEVQEDIDGQTRDPLNPDIGADELIVTPYDAALVSVVTPRNPVPNGINPVAVSLFNLGLEELSSVRIDWMVNDQVQSPYFWTGSLASGDSLSAVVLGNYNFSGEEIFRIRAWCSLPSGQNDAFADNDTTLVDSLYTGMNGLYTIGGFNPDFQSFTEASNALQRRGVAGPVTFNVRDGTYSEQINLPHILGSSAERPVIFQSEARDSSEVLLAYTPGTSSSAGNYVLELDGTTFISFRDLSFQNIATFSGFTVRVRGQSGPVRFEHCAFIDQGEISGSTSDRLLYIWNDNKPKRIEVQNCLFAGGSSGISGGDPGSSEQASELLISNSRFMGQSNNGIELQRVGIVEIRDNYFEGSTFSYGASIGVDGQARGVIITSNRIILERANNGIELQSLSLPPDNPALIANNFVYISNPDQAGIYSYYGEYQRFYFNSVHLGGSNLRPACYLIWGEQKIMVNNILANSGEGYALRLSGDGLVRSDHNDLFSTGNTLVYSGNNAISDLEQWQQTSGLDMNSVSIDPLFTAPNDWHVNQIQLDEKAIPIAGITLDLDGETRDPVSPDIGADEFKIVPLDLEVLSFSSPQTNCQLTQEETVTVLLRNYYETAISGFDISFSVNDGPLQWENTGAFAVPPGDTASYTFNRTLDASQTGTYLLKVQVSLSGDIFPGNDTLSASFRHIPKPTSPDNMLPAGGTTDLPVSINFSWTSGGEGVVYDFYIWPDSLEPPENPTRTSLNRINYTYSNLEYATTYNWKIVARNNFCGTESITQQFTTRQLPDLIVSSISVPDIAFSEQEISIDFTVMNQGLGSTPEGAFWYDYIYLSPSFSPNDPGAQFLGNLSNPSALQPGESYPQNNFTFTVPQGFQGTYYVLVVTNSFGAFTDESNQDNNLGISAAIPVRLTPPPDLQVSKTIVPVSAFSETKAGISWTVGNLGEGPTSENSWQDGVYLSQDTVYQQFTDRLLLSKRHNGILLKDSSYSVTDTIEFPEQLSGTFYLIFRTDINNEVFEFFSDNNNHRLSDSIRLFLTPPADLQAVDLQIPKTVVANRESLDIRWSVRNRGASLADEAWYDRLDLVHTQTGQVIYLGNFYRPRVLLPDETYENLQSVTMPPRVNGTYYLRLTTDAYANVFEFGNEENNTLRSQEIITIVSPDLEVVNIQAPATASSETNISLSWTVNNKGEGDLLNGYWTDRVLLSKSPEFTPANIVAQAQTFRSAADLPAGSTYTVSTELYLPAGLSGTHYLSVMTDRNGAIYETEETNNTLVAAESIQIDLAPWPDLQVDEVTSPIEIVMAGTNIDLSYTVTNYGQGAIVDQQWQDYLYVIPATDNSGQQARLLSIKQQNRPLEPDASYSENITVLLPGSLLGGSYRLEVRTDYHKNIFEHTAEENNTGLSQPFEVEGFPPVDLAIISAEAPGVTNSGASINVRWAVRNQGTNTTNASTWVDAVYLSGDTLWDETDIQLGLAAINEQLGAGRSYSRILPLQIPLEAAGTYYLLVVTDRNYANTDSNFENNIRIVSVDGSSGSGNEPPAPITITPAPTSDLLVSAFSVTPEVVIAGQPINLTWTVTNQGDTVTRSNYWTDYIRLSDNANSGTGRLLASFGFSGTLQPGENYQQSKEIIIPQELFGNWIISVSADGSNVEFERDAEDNNRSSQNLTILQPAPTDLLVSSIRVPPTAMVGDQMTVEWTVGNFGVDPAEGYMREAVFLSQDTLWDLADLLLGTVNTYIQLGPGESADHQLTTTLESVAVDDYYTIVRTDVLNNIFESSDTNNTTASMQTTRMSVPLLPLNTLLADTLPNNSQLYYRIEIPDSLAGESLLVSLSGDALSGRNELYLRYDNIPSRTQYDVSHSAPYQSRQEVLIPRIEPGTYYLLAYGVSTQGPEQPVSLLAEILNFELRSVDADSGGNTGEVTVRLEGGKFTEDMVVRLNNEQTTITGQSMQYVNPSLSYITFNLSGQPTGLYDVSLELPSGEQTGLADGFTITTGTAGDLSVRILHPEGTRPNRFVTLTISYENKGNIDVLSPMALLRSLAGAPIALTQPGLEAGLTELALDLLEEGGPPDRLRPGAGGTINVYTKSTSLLGFILDIQN